MSIPTNMSKNTTAIVQKNSMHTAPLNSAVGLQATLIKWAKLNETLDLVSVIDTMQEQAVSSDDYDQMPKELKSDHATVCNAIRKLSTDISEINQYLDQFELVFFPKQSSNCKN